MGQDPDPAPHRRGRRGPDHLGRQRRLHSLPCSSAPAGAAKRRTSKGAARWNPRRAGRSNLGTVLLPHPSLRLQPDEIRDAAWVAPADLPAYMGALRISRLRAALAAGSAFSRPTAPSWTRTRRPTPRDAVSRARQPVTPPGPASAHRSLSTRVRALAWMGCQRGLRSCREVRICPTAWRCLRSGGCPGGVAIAWWPGCLRCRLA